MREQTINGIQETANAKKSNSWQGFFFATMGTT